MYHKNYLFEYKSKDLFLSPNLDIGDELGKENGN